MPSASSEAMAFIREDYPRFLGLSLKRFIYYWGGVPRLSEIPALAPTKNSVFLASSVLAFCGPGTRLAQAQARSLAFLLADPVLSGGVLRRFPASPLSSSHRAGAWNSDGVRDFRSAEKERQGSRKSSASRKLTRPILRGLNIDDVNRLAF